MRPTLDAVARWWCRHHTVLYALFAVCCTVYVASVFYSYMLFQTQGVWSAPLDDVFIHFDYARSFARGFPFHWSEGNGYSSGNTSLTYPVVLSFGYWLGFRGLGLMVWAALLASLSVLVFLLGSATLVDEERRWARFLIPPAVLSLGALDWTLFSGMENAFHLGVWATCLVLCVRQERAGDCRAALRRAWLLGVGCAFLCATRPESGVCVAAFAAYAAILGHTRGHTRGWRGSALVLTAAVVPSLLFLALQSGLNFVFTGEWSANGAIAKLFMNDPYMTAAEKWTRYEELLRYIGSRLVDHHFSSRARFGYLIIAAAIVPLLSKRLRPMALMMWAQIIGWMLLVSLNNQVRWHNERYAMPAVAWLLVLAAIGVGVIASRSLPMRVVSWIGAAWEGRVWPVRAGAAALMVLLYWNAQAPRHKDQVWFFGRASRNILDQHVTAGMVLRNMNVRRVLVGDAGALTYASDVPGLDLIGLGGYHEYPFARSTRQGLGASIELIERIPPAERPDHMALYPSWWEDLPGFGDYVTMVPVHGNVICGGSEKVLYEANWSALDRRGNPRSMLDGETVADQLDVGDLISERDHDYNFPQPGMGYVDYRVLPDPGDEREDLFDAGRKIPLRETERATLRAPGGAARLILRVATWRNFASEVSVDGRVIGRVETQAKLGWQELTLPLPSSTTGEFELGLTALVDEAVTYHVWVVSR